MQCPCRSSDGETSWRTSVMQRRAHLCVRGCDHTPVLVLLLPFFNSRWRFWMTLARPRSVNPDWMLGFTSPQRRGELWLSLLASLLRR